MDASNDLAPKELVGSSAQTEPKDIDPIEKKVRFDTSTEDVEEDGGYQPPNPSTPIFINQNLQIWEEEDSWRVGS